MNRPFTGTAALLLALTLLVPPGAALKVPLTLWDPDTGDSAHHGIATEDTHDEWNPFDSPLNGGCLDVYTWHQLTLAIDADPTDDHPTLKLSATHDGPHGWTTQEAIATPDNPATLHVRQGSSCYSFTVEALEVSVPTSYTVYQTSCGHGASSAC